MTQLLVTVEYNEVIPITFDQVLNSEILESGHVMWDEDVWYCEPCSQEVVGEKNIIDDQELCGGCYEDILYKSDEAVFCDIHNAWVKSDPCNYAGVGGDVCEDCLDHLTAKWK
jgi:hypothetical protein